jgi:hypothetical protein
MYFLGALLEGFILSRASPMLVGMLIFSSLGAVIVSQYRTGELEDFVEEDWSEDEAEYELEGPEADEAYGTYGETPA